MVRENERVEGEEMVEREKKREIREKGEGKGK